LFALKIKEFELLKNLLPNRSVEQAGFFKFFDFFRRVTKP